jgi:hypothetical protein
MAMQFRSLYTRLALGALIVLPAAGCHQSLPPQADPAAARTALTAALEAWQKGESTEDLAKRSPPIYFNDQKCVPDVKLISFKIEDSQDFYGQSVRIKTVLTLKMKDGSTREKKAGYLIDTSPATVIVPE